MCADGRPSKQRAARRARQRLTFTPAARKRSKRGVGTTESNIWKIQIYEEPLEDAEERFGTETTRTLRYFAQGRPLLGKRIETSWSHYAWLETREVEALHGSLARFLEDHSDPTGEGFLEEFQSWLASIREAGRDLWLYTQ